MKNKITCLLAGVALFGATANADIAIGDGLTAYGYIDMGLSDTNEAAPNGARSQDFAEYEIGLSFAPAESKWSAVVELSYGKTGNGTGTQDDATSSFETAAVTYQHNDALSFSFGNLYTYQGLESHDAPNNNFISYAGSGDNDLYSANFAEGVSADYSAGDITVGVWAEADAGADFEYYAAYSGIANLTLSVAIADNEDGSGTDNFMAVYEMGDFTISAETVDTENAAGAETLDVTSVAVAYNLGDTTIAVRSVDGDYNGGPGALNGDYEKISIAAFHALSDNVAVGVEYSEEELAADDVDGFAVELLYVF